ELCGVLTQSSFVHHGERLRQHAQPFLYLSHLPIRLGEQGKHKRPCPRCPCGLQGRDTLAYLRNPCLALSLFRQCPASCDRARCQPHHKTLLRREENDGLCPRLGGLHLPAEPMECGRI